MDKENIVLTVGCNARTGFIVSVETITRRGIFQFDIIGLANKTISESKQRILSAISFSLGEKRHYINKKITTLLSPADSKKEGSHFDLPIAISYLISVKKLAQENLTSKSTSKVPSVNISNVFSDVIVLGELTLTGSVLPIKQAPLLIREGINQGIKYFIIPNGNIEEISKFEDIFLWPVNHISEVIKVFGNDKASFFEKFEPTNTASSIEDIEPSKILQRQNATAGKYTKIVKENYLLDSIEGNTTAKRVLEIALAGKHHVLFIGTPGSGKSLLAKASKELIPKLDTKDANIFQIRQIDQQKYTSDDTSSEIINFRQPHHTSSYSEIIGNRILPGEIVLAHRGILYMDELVEFNRRVLEALRQPMEDKYIQKNYLTGDEGDSTSLIPTEFILLGCMNPCDCGYTKSDKKKCICTQGQLDKYRRKMHSPLFQRFEMCLYVQGNRRTNNLKSGDTTGNTDENMYRDNDLSAVKIKEVIERVRHIQEQREKEMSKKSHFDLEDETKKIFADICIKFNFSKREEVSLLKVARTIADIEESDIILKEHLLEASSYKRALAI